jgi:hypothetical protein
LPGLNGQLRDQLYADVIELDERNLMSGVVILTQEAVWKKIRLVSGFLEVDNTYHRDCLKPGYIFVPSCQEVHGAQADRRPHRRVVGPPRNWTPTNKLTTSTNVRLRRGTDHGRAVHKALREMTAGAGEVAQRPTKIACPKLI